MRVSLIIFLLTLFMYIPLATILLYVWWKYGKGEPGVLVARTVFLTGSLGIILYMITI